MTAPVVLLSGCQTIEQARDHAAVILQTLPVDLAAYYIAGVAAGDWPQHGHARYLMAAAFREALRS